MTTPRTGSKARILIKARNAYFAKRCPRAIELDELRGPAREALARARRQLGDGLETLILARHELDAPADPPAATDLGG
ncbi:MAG: hypothetical protein M1522_02335 [Actinobacteria bacterium]|nr:hypothetical protein [Actinomycetota bacterium]